MPEADVIRDLVRFLIEGKKKKRAPEAQAQDFPAVIIWSQRELSLEEGFLLQAIQCSAPNSMEQTAAIARYLILRSDGTLTQERLMGMPLVILPALMTGAMEALAKGESKRKNAIERALALQAAEQDRIRAADTPEIPQAFLEALEGDDGGD